MSIVVGENNTCREDLSAPASKEAQALYQIFSQVADILLDAEQFLIRYLYCLRQHRCSCFDHQESRLYIEARRADCRALVQKLSDLYEQHNLETNLPVALGIAFEKVRGIMMTMMQNRIFPKIQEIKDTRLDCRLKGQEGHSCQ